MLAKFHQFKKLFFIATAVALATRLFILEDYHIVSNSMSPGLVMGDLVFVNKAAFNLRLPFSSYELFKIRRPRRGEVVAFSLPDKGLDTFVKRVVGFEGDRIEIRQGTLYLNKTALKYSENERVLASNQSKQVTEENQENYSYPILLDKNKNANYGPVDVPEGHFFVLGDNRIDSIDSRVWGPVPYSCLKGKPKLVWMSLNESKESRKGRSGIWIK